MIRTHWTCGLSSVRGGDGSVVVRLSGDMRARVLMGVGMWSAKVVTASVEMRATDRDLSWRIVTGETG